MERRDVFILKGGADKSEKFFQITHIYKTTIDARFADEDKAYRKAELGRQVGEV